MQLTSNRVFIRLLPSRPSDSIKMVRAVSVILVLFLGSSLISGLPYGTPEEGPYFEGDILEKPTDELTKAGIIGEQYRWPGARVPYQIDDRFDNEDRLLILTGLAHLEKYTCLEFVERTTEADYVFVNYGAPGSGYFSSVGRRGGSQTLNLEPELVDRGRFGTIVHEFIHAIGYYHEQSRTDRDDWVYINWSNIQPGKEGNFNKYTATQVDPNGVSYDYGSIMHYSSKGFAIDPNVDTIIVPGWTGATIGQRVRLSEKDIIKINNMYCPEEVKQN